MMVLLRSVKHRSGQIVTDDSGKEKPTMHGGTFRR